MCNGTLERTIIVVGKSKLLNKLIDKNIFLSSFSQSCTNKVKSSNWRRVTFKSKTNNRECSFELNAYDTPGIADSQGQTKRILNEITQTIKTTALNLNIVLVEYGRMDTNAYNNCEILGKCLNGMYESMLIVNK